MRHGLLWSSLCLSISWIHGQTPSDSLWSIWNDNSRPDSTRASAIHSLSRSIISTQPDSAIRVAVVYEKWAANINQDDYQAQALNTQGIGWYYLGDLKKAKASMVEAIRILRGSNDTKTLGSVIGNLAAVCRRLGEYENSIGYSNRSLEISKGLKDQVGVGNAYHNMGTCYHAMGRFDDALASYQQAVLQREKLKDTIGMSDSYTGFGNTYQELGNNERAFEYYNLSLKMLGDRDDPRRQAALQSNLGQIAESWGRLKKAKEYHVKALEGYTSLGDQQNIAMTYNNLSQLFASMERWDEAIAYGEKAIEIKVNTGAMEAIGINYSNLGNTYLKVGQYNKSLDYCREGLTRTLKIDGLKDLPHCYRCIYKAFEGLENYDSALVYQELYLLFRDSVYSTERIRKITDMSVRFEYTKQAIVDSVEHESEQGLRNARIENQRAEIGRERAQRYALTGGLGLGACLALVIFLGLRRRKRANVTISGQKEEVEGQRKEILDNIAYAESIQRSMLPDPRQIWETLPGFKVLYRPRDIVGGDFYWHAQDQESSYIVLADCTGHGVPGAFMTMIGVTVLKDLIEVQQLQNPAEILAHMDKEVKEILKQEDLNSPGDGMDLTLLRIDHSENQAVFCGANHNLFVKTNSGTNKLRGTRRSIGGWSGKKAPKEFENVDLDLKEIQAIVMTSDGLEDQLDAAGQESFGRERFMELIAQNDPGELTSKAETALKNWQGFYPQLDDLCLICIDLSAAQVT